MQHSKEAQHRANNGSMIFFRDRLKQDGNAGIVVNDITLSDSGTFSLQLVVVKNSMQIKMSTAVSVVIHGKER
jgi:hypothetical protein